MMPDEKHLRAVLAEELDRVGLPGIATMCRHGNDKTFQGIGAALAAMTRIAKERDVLIGAALIFMRDIATEELQYVKVGTGAEVALRHIKRRAEEQIP